MARQQSDGRLNNRTQRLKLETCKRHSLNLGRNHSLIYRRGKKGPGVWSCRVIDNQKKQQMTKIGIADDYQDVDENNSVVSFADAQNRCRYIADQAALPQHKKRKDISMDDAITNYLDWFKVHRSSIGDVTQRVDKYIRPCFGGMLVSDISTKMICDWRDKIANTPPQTRSGKASGTQANYLASWIASNETVRKRKSSTNRTLTTLKAILNKAFADNLVSDDAEWRRVKPFSGVDKPIVRWLTEAECEKLIQCCAPDFQKMVVAGLLTGCRYSELSRLCVNDFKRSSTSAGIWVSITKSKTSRFIDLNSEGEEFFSASTQGKKADENIFLTSNGFNWTKSLQTRRIKEASINAGISPYATFHQLRHSYASHLVQNGVHMKIVASLLGHTTTRITERHYGHLDPNRFRAEVAKLPTFYKSSTTQPNG